MTREPHVLLVDAFFVLAITIHSPNTKLYKTLIQRKRKAMMYLDVTVMAFYTGLGNFLHIWSGPISWVMGDIWVMLDRFLFKQKQMDLINIC